MFRISPLPHRPIGEVHPLIISVLLALTLSVWALSQVFYRSCEKLLERAPELWVGKHPQSLMPYVQWGNKRHICTWQSRSSFAPRTPVPNTQLQDAQQLRASDNKCRYFHRYFENVVQYKRLKHLGAWHTQMNKWHCVRYHVLTVASKRRDDGGIKHLWNVGTLFPNYTAQQPSTAVFTWNCISRAFKSTLTDSTQHNLI
jgi:hypothetical protein